MEEPSEAAALQLLAAVRQPGTSEDLLRRLDVAGKALPWVKWLTGLIGAAFVAIMHVEIKLSRIEDNSDSIKMNSQRIETINQRAVVWDRAADEWRNFSYGSDSDLAHNREMWWMKQHGIIPNKESAPKITP